ncbi:alkaline phosphatase 4-like [Malaya genurostris]|uniref:alkaline phosphatase 4-like n=1 Tax=Malaya genurostris TaxID=325434 RepID=UPI0026F38A36|nr:alkaline phosphatase 4-like [Malaya genurostris]
MNSSRAKNSWRLVLSGALCVLICDIHWVAAAVFKSPNKDDATYWRNNAETYLKRVLQYDSHQHGIGVAKNVIIFVGDGMGVSTLSTGRIFKGQMAGRSGEEESLTFDHFPYTGFAKTYNTDRQVPDSAGTATALFTGVKTKYGVIGVDYTVTETNELSASVSNIMEWAQMAGKRTGIVTTTRVTHATPAATYAHSFNRNWECNIKIPDNLRNKTKDIARQLVENAPGNKLNVILGGGRSELGVSMPDLMNTDNKINGSMDKPCNRTDGRNLVNTWLEDKKGLPAAFVMNTSQLLSTDVDEIDYLLGLFANEHMSYDRLRDKTGGGEPSLSDMTEKAIRVLKRKHSNGFVLMVEGGRIDHGHHQNIPRLALSELVELDRAVERALGLIDLEDTLVIVTADHSHAMTFNGYPDRGNDILGFGNRPDKLPYETISYANGPGFRYHRANDNPEVPKHHGTWIPVETMDRSAISYRHLSALPLDDETHGGEDVAVFAAGPGSGLVRGTFEQNYIAYVMSYAGCMGPAKRMNEGCWHRKSSSGVVASAYGVGTVTQLLISISSVMVARLCHHF